jgi:hypothetical protein
VNSKTDGRSGWLRTWFSRLAVGRSPKRGPAKLRREMSNRRLRCEMLERRELLSGVPTVVTNPGTYMTIPISSSGGTAYLTSGSSNFTANANIVAGASAITYTSPTVGTVTGELNGIITASSNSGDVGANFVSNITNITIASGTLSLGSGSVNVLNPSDLVGSATTLSNSSGGSTFDTSQFTSTNTTINWNSVNSSNSPGTGQWINGIVNSTLTSPFTIGLTNPQWDYTAQSPQLDFGFNVTGNWYPVGASAYSTPVASINAYWGSNATTILSTNPNPIGSSVPIYWNEAAGTASIQGLSGAIPAGANYVLIEVATVAPASPQITNSLLAFNLSTPAVTSVTPADGRLAGGTSVTLTGVNLANTTAVNFGSQSANFTFNPVSGSPLAGTITATVPSTLTAGPVHVTVTSSGLVSAMSSANQYAYTSVTPSSVAGMAPDGSWWMASSNGTNFVNQFWGAWNGSITWKFVQVGDFTGNGRKDIVGMAPDGSWWVALSTGTGFVNQYWGSWNSSVNWTNVHVADFTGNGKADIVGMSPDGSWWVALSTGSSFVNQYWGGWSNSFTWQDVRVGDLTGNGKKDIVGMAPDGSWWVALSTGTSFTNQYWGGWNPSAGWQDVQLADVNGDGKMDIVGMASSGDWWVAISNGTTFTNQYWGGWNAGAGWQDVQVADVNGDGKADIVGMTSTGDWWVALSTGTSFTNQYWGSWNPSAGWQDVQVADVNGDGKSDIVGMTSSGAWFAAVSTGTTFVSQYWGSWSAIAWQDVSAGTFGT